MIFEGEDTQQSQLGKVVKIVRGIKLERVQNLSNVCLKEIVFILVEESCDFTLQFGQYENVSSLPQMCLKPQSQLGNQRLEHKSRNL